MTEEPKKNKGGRPRVTKTPPPEEPKTPEEVQVPVEAPKVEVAPEVERVIPKVDSIVDRGVLNVESLPFIKTGTCEFCGAAEYDHSSPQKPVKLLTVDPETQIGRCQHYNGVQIRCSYCPANADWAGNIKHRNHKVFKHPYEPNKLVVVCSDMSCADKNARRFNQT